MPGETLKTFIAGLPKAELHIHLEGSTSAETLARLARKHGVALPHGGDPALLFDFRELEDFFEVYELSVNSMREISDFHLVTYEMLAHCAESNTRYVEFFFNPQPHLAHGITYRQMMAGITAGMEDALRDFGIRSGVIPSYDRRLGPGPGIEFMEMIAADRPETVLGIGMDYLEHPHPPSAYHAMYARARQMGLNCTAHVGFRGPAEHVWEAVDVLRCSRIDHGYHLTQNKVLLERCKEREIGFTCCPTSVLTASKWRDGRAADHPVRVMIEAGLPVTLNTDDPGLFRTSLNEQFQIVGEQMGVNRAGLIELARNAIRTSWLDAGEKSAILSEWNTLDVAPHSFG